MTALPDLDRRMGRPFSPERLAERWGCSAEKVRRMYHDRQLAGFRLGKLIRIPAVEVERYECQNTPSDGIGTDSSLPSTKTESAFDDRLALTTGASPRLAPVNSGRSAPRQNRKG